MSSNTNKYAIVVITIIMSIVPVMAKAQIKEYIEEKVTSYLKEKAEDYIDGKSGGMYYKAKSFLTNPLGTLWGEFVDADARISVARKATGLATFDVSEEQLNALRKQYGIAPLMPTDQKTLILPIQYGISESFGLAVSPVGNRKIGNLGEISRSTKAYLDSLNAMYSVKTLENVLVQETLDSLKELSNEFVNRKLLEDINMVPQLISTLNRHPEAVRVYANSLNTSLRYKSFHLIYWGGKADSHRHKLPRKTKLPNPRFFLFKQDGDAVAILYNGRQIGSYSPRLHKIDCWSAELLNYMPMPKCSYTFGSTIFSTDILGRLTYLNAPLCTRGKAIIKTSVKPKDLQKAVGIDGKNAIYSKMLKKMKLQPAIAFIQTPASCISCEKVKEEQKAFKNRVKQVPNALVDFMFFYKNGGIEPQLIEISNADKANPPINRAKYGGFEEQQEFVQNLKLTKSERYVMDGNIGGKYPIVMNIVCQGNAVTGNYFYSKSGNKKRMVLLGTINSERYAEVKEYDEKGVCQGQFNGKIQTKGIFNGTFTKKNKQMNFSVKSLLRTK